jgi:hypothetical protein
MILSIFCASHITSSSDFRHLKAAIDSVTQQTRPTKLWLSISHSPNVDHDSVGDWLLQHLPNSSRCIRAKSQKQQFEHYNLLLTAYLKQHPSATSSDEAFHHWISFIDDDDTIGKRRMHAIVSLVRYREREDVRNINGGVPLREAVQVVQDDGSESVDNEYWQFTVTARLFYWFLERAGPLVRQSRYADMFLRYFLLNHKEDGVITNTLFADGSQHPDIVYKYSPRPGTEGTMEEEAWKGMTNHLYKKRSEFTDDSYVEYMMNEVHMDVLGLNKQQVREFAQKFRREKAEQVEAMKNAPYLDEYLRDHPQFPSR